MNKTILIMLILIKLVWPTNYFVSITGTATSKTTATGPDFEDNSKCMNIKVAKGQTYSGGDSIIYGYSTGTDSVYRDTGTTIFKTPSFNSVTPIVYKAGVGKHPIINASDLYTHGTLWHWHASATPNYYYVTTAGDANPSIASLPVNIWINDYKYKSGSLSYLYDRQCAYGDIDGLGYSTVYIRRDEANPAIDGAKIEFSVTTRYAWNCNIAGNGLVVEGFKFTHGANFLVNTGTQDTNIIINNCIFEQANSLLPISRWRSSQINSCLFQNSLSSSFYASQISAVGNGSDGSVSFNYCVFQNIAGTAIYTLSDSAITQEVNNCTFYGIGSHAILMGTTSRANMFLSNSILHVCQFLMSGNGYELENFSLVGGTIHIANSYLGPCAIISNHIRTSNCINDGNNDSSIAPFINHSRRSVVFGYTDDDSQNWPTMRDSLRFLRDSTHIPMTQAFNFTNLPNSPYNTTIWWDSVIAWVAQGNGITLHTRSHFNLSVPSCLSIIYSEGVCSLSIDTATHYLTTIVPDNPERNLSIKLDSNRYLYWYGTDSLVNRINRTTGYTATNISTFSLSSMYDSATGHITLASLTKKDISLKCTLQYNHAVLFSYELSGNYWDLRNKTGYTPKAVIFSTASPTDAIAFDTCVALGLLGTRSGGTEAVESNFEYWNLYNLRSWAISYIDQTNDTTVDKSIFGHFDYAAFAGKPSFFYEHASPSSVPTYRRMLRSISKYKDYYPFTKFMTLDSILLFSINKGALKDSSRYLELPYTDSTDLRLKNISPLLIKGDTNKISGIANLYDMSGKQITDANGHVLLSNISMGAYNDPPFLAFAFDSVRSNAGVDSGYWGDTINFYGALFGSTQGTSTLNLQDSTPIVTSWNDNRISIILPNLDTGWVDTIRISDGTTIVTLLNAFKVLLFSNNNGVLVQWENSGSTDASLASNYNPTQVPDSLDTLRLNTGSTNWVQSNVMHFSQFQITSGWTGKAYINDTLHCNYFNMQADSVLFSYPVIVRDSIVYGAASKPKGLPGSRIESIPGYTLTVKLNGVLNSPPVRNRSKIKWR
jgi:hypothetical protein